MATIRTVTDKIELKDDTDVYIVATERSFFISFDDKGSYSITMTTKDAENIADLIHESISKVRA